LKELQQIRDLSQFWKAYSWRNRNLLEEVETTKSLQRGMSMTRQVVSRPTWSF
jgi:hypothetical protein